MKITNTTDNVRSSLTPNPCMKRTNRRPKKRRTITVHENGAILKGGEFLPTLYYTFSTKNTYRSQQEAEMKKFYRAC